MKRRNLYLLLGILLSIASKWLQIYSSSTWGDILILPAATFFVLTILLSIPQYQTFLETPELRRPARILALYACLVILSFQLFTMVTFGRDNTLGIAFLFPVVLFLALSLYQWHSLTLRDK